MYIPNDNGSTLGLQLNYTKRDFERNGVKVRQVWKQRDLFF